VRTWTGSVYLATTGVRTPERPVCSQSPYHLRFRGRRLDKYTYLICFCEVCYRDNSSKVHFLFLHSVKTHGWVVILLHTFIMSALDSGEWSVSCTCHCTLGKDDNVPKEYGARWSNGAVRKFWTRGKYIL